jgi:hypothetical protein
MDWRHTCRAVWVREREREKRERAHLSIKGERMYAYLYLNKQSIYGRETMIISERWSGLLWEGFFGGEGGGTFNPLWGCLALSLVYQLDSPSVVAMKNVTRHCQMSPGCQNYPQIRTVLEQ